MDEIKLRYFTSVARHLSFTKAAEDCHVVQSTISKQIAALEEELGVRLFIRDNQTVRLTAVGERLAACTDTYMAQYQAINDNIQNLISYTERKLRISVGPFEFPLLAILAEQVRQKAPEVEFHPTSNSYWRMEAHLRSGTLNLALGIRPCAEHLPNVQTVSLGTHRWKVTARKDSPFWCLPPEQQAMLQDQTVIAFHQNELDPIRAYCQVEGLRPRGYGYGGYFMTVAAMVQAGGRVAVIPEYLEPWLSPDLRMEDVFRRPMEVENVLLYNPRAADKPTTEFFEFVRTLYEE